MQKNFSLLISVALLFCTALNSEAQAKPGAHRAGGRDKYAIKDIDLDLRDWGRLKANLREDAMVIDDPLRDYTVCCKAPDWMVSVYSKKRKLLTTIPLSKYDGGLTGRLTKMTGGGFQKGREWQVIGEGKVLGYLCTIRGIKPDAKNPRDRSCWRHYAAREIPVKPQVLDFYYKSCGIPPMDGFCLKFVTGSDMPSTLIEAHSIKDRKTNGDPFAIPAGLKKASLEEVMFVQQDF